MKTNKKIIIYILLILTTLSLIGVVNASNSTNENIASEDTSDVSIEDSSNSINEVTTTNSDLDDLKKEEMKKNLKSNPDTDDKIKDNPSKIIYVSKTGNDDNDGSENKPVANISKAIDLSKTGSGKIIINEGIYTENGIIIDTNLDISTKGEVIIDGNGLRAFDIKSGDIKITNIMFTNCNSSYGGAVLRITGGSLLLDNCNFIKNGGEYRDNLIRATNADLTILNCLFENNTAHKTSTNYGGVYVSDSTLYVDNTVFRNNYNKYGQLYITGSSKGSSAIIKNSKFIGNNATSASGGTGAAIYLGGTSTYTLSNGTVRPGAPTSVSIENCEFINNSAKGGKYYEGKGGAIFVNNNASLLVSKSKFINNFVEDNTNGSLPGKGGAIFASAGAITITESLFENNIAKNGSEIYMKYYGKDNITLNKLNVSTSTFNNTGDAKIIEADYNNGTLIANNNDWIGITNVSSKVSIGIIVEKNNATNNSVEPKTPKKEDNTQQTTSTDKDKTKQTTNTPKQIIVAKNLKVKKSAKTLKIKVTLKKLNGKLLKNKQIKIKLNGKIYKTRTNKKAVATFKIPKKAMQKLKTGKTYKYTITYGKYKLTKKITIKK